jgi:hypothetical protein
MLWPEKSTHYLLVNLSAPGGKTMIGEHRELGNSHDRWILDPNPHPVPNQFVELFGIMALIALSIYDVFLSMPN